MSRFREILLGMLAVLVAAIFLNIFLPGSIVKIAVSILGAFFIFKWLRNALNLSEVWTNRLFRFGIALALIHFAFLGINLRWPWFGQALEARQYYVSLWASDRLNPKYPKSLPITLYKTEAIRLETQEGLHVEALQEIQDKLRAGKELDASDLAKIEEAKSFLPELAKKFEAMNLARPRSPKSAYAVRASSSEQIIERVALPGNWCESVSIPLFHRSRTETEGHIRVRAWDGREFERWSGDGGGPWLGRVGEASFQFMSLEDKPVKVSVLLEPMRR